MFCAWFSLIFKNCYIFCNLSDKWFHRIIPNFLFFVCGYNACFQEKIADYVEMSQFNLFSIYSNSFYFEYFPWFWIFHFWNFDWSSDFLQTLKILRFWWNLIYLSFCVFHDYSRNFYKFGIYELSLSLLKICSFVFVWLFTFCSVNIVVLPPVKTWITTEKWMTTENSVREGGQIPKGNGTFCEIRDKIRSTICQKFAVKNVEGSGNSRFQHVMKIHATTNFSWENDTNEN